MRPPISSSLLDLAPQRLPNHCTTRYKADDVCVALKDLAERDRLLLVTLYGQLTALLFAIADTASDDARKWHDVGLWIGKSKLDRIIDEVRELGVQSHEQNPSTKLSKAMHDLRGGALSALLGRLQLLDHLPRDSEQLKTLFVLARDHLKIMRSAVVDLDEVRHEADKRPKSHDIQLILDKWQDSVIGPKWEQRPVRMSIDCRYAGALTECCLESAAVDRIFYNVANNACRHVVGARIDMAIFPVPDPASECLRFVLSNRVGEEDVAYLESMGHEGAASRAVQGKGLDLPRLFEPAVSSTGSGYGLTVVADFVAGAFGLRDSRQALRERYVGAILEEGIFRVWFHWPAANNALPPKLDDYRQPDESLSEP